MICKECGKDYRNLGRHLRKMHNSTLEEYAKKYSEKIINPYNGDIFNYFECKVCGNPFVLRCRGGKSLEIVGCNTCKSKNPLHSFQSIYGWDEGFRKLNQVILNSRFSKKRAIEKYGQDLGNIKISQWLEKVSQSKESFIRRYGEDIGNIKYQEFVDKSKRTLPQFIGKYGLEEGNRIYKLYCKRKTRAFKSTLGYYLSLGFSPEEARKFQTKYQTWIGSKERYIREFGLEEGSRLYLEKMERQMLHFRGKSNLEIEVFSEIVDLLDLDRAVIRYANNQWFCNLGKFFYFLDYYDMSLNLCIEFYGDYWHANPKLYSEKDYLVYPGIGVISAQEIWERDRIRIENIQKHLNCKILIIWEYNWNHNKDEVIQEVINLYKEVLNNENSQN